MTKVTAGCNAGWRNTDRSCDKHGLAQQSWHLALGHQNILAI